MNPRPRPILLAVCALALLASATAGETIKWITAGTDDGAGDARA